MNNFNDTIIKLNESDSKSNEKTYKIYNYILGFTSEKLKDQLIDFNQFNTDDQIFLLKRVLFQIYMDKSDSNKPLINKIINQLLKNNHGGDDNNTNIELISKIFPNVNLYPLLKLILELVICDNQDVVLFAFKLIELRYSPTHQNVNQFNELINQILYYHFIKTDAKTRLTELYQFKEPLVWNLIVSDNNWNELNGCKYFLTEIIQHIDTNEQFKPIESILNQFVKQQQQQQSEYPYVGSNYGTTIELILKQVVKLPIDKINYLKGHFQLLLSTFTNIRQSNFQMIFEIYRIDQFKFSGNSFPLVLFHLNQCIIQGSPNLISNQIIKEYSEIIIKNILVSHDNFIELAIILNKSLLYQQQFEQVVTIYLKDLISNGNANIVKLLEIGKLISFTSNQKSLFKEFYHHIKSDEYEYYIEFYYTYIVTVECIDKLLLGSIYQTIKNVYKVDIFYKCSLLFGHLDIRFHYLAISTIFDQVSQNIIISSKSEFKMLNLSNELIQTYHKYLNHVLLLLSGGSKSFTIIHKTEFYGLLLGNLNLEIISRITTAAYQINPFSIIILKILNIINCDLLLLSSSNIGNSTTIGGGNSNSIWLNFQKQFDQNLNFLNNLLVFDHSRETLKSFLINYKSTQLVQSSILKCEYEGLNPWKQKVSNDSIPLLPDIIKDDLQIDKLKTIDTIGLVYEIYKVYTPNTKRIPIIIQTLDKLIQQSNLFKMAKDKIHSMILIQLIIDNGINGDVYSGKFKELKSKFIEIILYNSSVNPYFYSKPLLNIIRFFKDDEIKKQHLNSIIWLVKNKFNSDQQYSKLSRKFIQSISTLINCGSYKDNDSIYGLSNFNWFYFNLSLKDKELLNGNGVTIRSTLQPSESLYNIQTTLLYKIFKHLLISNDVQVSDKLSIAYINKRCFNLVRNYLFRDKIHNMQPTYLNRADRKRATTDGDKFAIENEVYSLIKSSPTFFKSFGLTVDCIPIRWLPKMFKKMYTIHISKNDQIGYWALLKSLKEIKVDFEFIHDNKFNKLISLVYTKLSTLEKLVLQASNTHSTYVNSQLLLDFILSIKYLKPSIKIEIDYNSHQNTIVPGLEIFRFINSFTCNSMLISTITDYSLLLNVSILTIKHSFKILGADLNSNTGEYYVLPILKLFDNQFLSKRTGENDGADGDTAPTCKLKELYIISTCGIDFNLDVVPILNSIKFNSNTSKSLKKLSIKIAYSIDSNNTTPSYQYYNNIPQTTKDSLILKFKQLFENVQQNTMIQSLDLQIPYSIELLLLNYPGEIFINNYSFLKINQ